MKKALEILKRISTTPQDLFRYSDTEIKTAIAELEALENRSCNNCKYYLSDNGNYPLYPCSECSRFYADSWEPK